MSFDDVKDIETRTEFNALNGVDQDKYDEIRGYMSDKTCMYTVHKTRSYCKTLLDVNFTFGTDFVLLQDDGCTRILIDSAKQSDIYQEFYDNMDVFYSNHGDYHRIKAKLEAQAAED